MIKDAGGHPDEGDACVGPGMREGTWSFCALSAHPPLQHLCVLIILEALHTPRFWDFYGGFLR